MAENSLHIITVHCFNLVVKKNVRELQLETAEKPNNVKAVSRDAKPNIKATTIATTVFTATLIPAQLNQTKEK